MNILIVDLIKEAYFNALENDFDLFELDDRQAVIDLTSYDGTLEKYEFHEVFTCYKYFKSSRN